MSTYLVTGVSRGIGFEFLRQLSHDPANTVIGMVRDKAATEAKITVGQLKYSNVHIVSRELTDYESLKISVGETTKNSGGRLDYLIANAALQSSPCSIRWMFCQCPPSLMCKWELGSLTQDDRGNDPVGLEKDLLDTFRTNIVGNIHPINLCMSLILKGREKKVIVLSTGIADLEAGMNLAMSKFSAQYAKDGMLFLSIAPGFVQTGLYDDATEEQLKKSVVMAGKFKSYAPHFEGKPTPEEAVRQAMSVAEKASVKGGDGDAFVSQFGNKQWF